MGAPHPLLLPLITGSSLPDAATITMEVVASAEEHWVAPLIDAAVTRSDIPTSRDARQRLTARSLATGAEVDRCMATAAKVVETAASLDIDIAVFKGVAIGSTFYESPHTRPSVDVDIFVGPDSLDRMGELIAALSGTAEDRAAADAQVAEGRVFEVTVDVEGVAVDIHRDPLNMVTPSRVEAARWARTVRLTLPDGTEVRTLDLEDTLIQALLHLFRDNFADLLHVNDIRLMIDAGPDWGDVERRAAEDGLTDIVRYALWFVAKALGIPSPLPTTITRWRKLVIDAVWPPSLLLQGHDSHAASLRRQSVLGLLVADRPGSLGSAYARRVFPPRSVIDHRSGVSDAPYPVALARWRQQQRRENTRFRSRGGDT